MNYGLPWIRPNATSPADATTINRHLKPSAYFGMASDYNAGSADYASIGHIHRFQDNSELKTTLRKGHYERDQRAGTVRLCRKTTNATTGVVSNPECPIEPVALDNFAPSTILTRGTNLKIQDLDSLVLQSDYSRKFSALGFKHELLAGIDYANESKNVYRATTPASATAALSKPKTLARSMGRTVAAIQEFLPVAIQLTAQFIRTLRNGILLGMRWARALALLRTSANSYL